MKTRSVERTMFFGAKPDIFRKAEILRSNMTEAEKILWEKLRKNQLGVRFKAQHPIESFIADFYCHKKKLVIEVDGEYHVKQKEYDEGREAEIEKYGITIIRFNNSEVFVDLENVMEKIKEQLSSL